MPCHLMLVNLLQPSGSPIFVSKGLYGVNAPDISSATNNLLHRLQQIAGL